MLKAGAAVVDITPPPGLAMAGFGGAVGLAPQARRLMLLAAVLMLVVGGAADMSSSALRNSMLQSAGSDAVRGRLQGVFIVVVAGGPRVADVVHGAAAAVIGPALTAGLGGLLVVVLVGWCAHASPTFLGYSLDAPDRTP